MRPGYVWEKVYGAIDCLCGDGSFAERLAQATISGLYRLEDGDVTGPLAQDLRFVLDWTKRNIREGKIQREPNESERKALVEKMLHVLLETTES